MIQAKPDAAFLAALSRTLLALAVLVYMSACGGGSGGGSQITIGGQPDFSLGLNPTSLSVSAGSSALVSLSASAVNGFSSQVSVQLTGVPAGVTFSPTSITLTSGTPQQVTFTAAASSASSNATVTFTGASGSLSHNTSLSLTVSGNSNGAPVRTRYLRTDATTEYFGFVNQHWMLYHATTGRYFVSDPSSNQIIVLDAASQTVIGNIGVPGAFGMDDTPDHSTIYVGTQIGDVYTIDPVSMTVRQRYIAAEIGPYGFAASQVLVLADGQVGLIGVYNGIDGTSGVALWNPTDNSAIVYGGLGGVGLPCVGPFGSFGGFARTVDRTQILVGGINGGGICEFNPTTGTSNFQSTGSDLQITTTPDGKSIILPSASGGVVVYDSQTLAPSAEFNLLGGAGLSSGFFVSADSTVLYVPQQTVIYAYSLQTQQLIGWVPNIYVPLTSGGFGFGPIGNPYLLATDGSGLFAGPMEEGVGFVDVSALQTGPIGTQFLNGYLNPATGPALGGTATSWFDPGTLGTLKSIYFGSQQATKISASSGSINVTSPPGKSGPTDVYTFTTDGGMQLLPEAFSYGPTILEVTPNMATAEGGQTGYIYGYGFGPTSSNSVPPDVQVTVGGVGVAITAFNGNAYNLASPPFPLQSLAYVVPAGTSGGSVDVRVTTSAGSATASGSLAYLPGIQQFSLASSALAQGIYDPHTNLYYFTDATVLQVFSRTQGAWLNPIVFPSSAQRLWGIALSPNGSNMAVSDLENGNIYLLNPATPTSIKTFSIRSDSSFVTNASGLAVSDSGNVYYMVVVIGQGGGADQFFKLDTSNGSIYNYFIDAPGLGNSDAYLRNAISADNARVFYNVDGYVISVDTATDKILPSAVGTTCCYGTYELSLSSNQTQLTATEFIYDADMNGESYYALNDREILNIAYVYGAKLSPDGRLLFQPSTNGIDVFDGNLGSLRSRIALPVALSINYDALASDGVDNILVAITGASGNGIAVVNLTSLPEPSSMSFQLRQHVPAHAAERNRLFAKPNQQPLLPNRAGRVPYVTRPLVPQHR